MAGLSSCRRGYTLIPEEYEEDGGVVGPSVTLTVPDGPEIVRPEREVGLQEGLQLRAAAIESSKRG